ncbi:malonyl-coenzyme A:anthocyanin 3-O-glucoside-6''-O-malonyltransferase-like [Arachis stenosperma]|uniref:malonyl-coenzyme A:anthocyanin 3-O-glucoside-6''-O-malonyltransferase-like n=1 Tax=Arachis stenosperma TaxID=217475 RepID=UPI0025AC2FCA|nr:malonyl-coenzyme A:anthocyanin 3-O-glucoside-6''-O-malonyltransferase-like [Arachis stenosperma]
MEKLSDDEHKLVEESKVAPNNPKATCLPLTFLDISLAGPIYGRRQFFYNFPYSTHYFLQTTFPTLKRSLSLTLQRFFPLAGNLLCPPPPHKPFIRCTEEDSVAFTVFQSSSDFNHLSSNNPRSLKKLNQLVPKLTCKIIHHHDTLVFPNLALQATVFPNRGVCIAITYNHMIDGACCSQFMKLWSSLCARGGIDLTFLEKSTPPCFNRGILKDPNELEAIFIKHYFQERENWKNKVNQSQPFDSTVAMEEDHVKVTIVLDKDDIERMKIFSLNQLKKREGLKSPQYVSKFVVACGFAWSSLVKARARDSACEEEENMKEEYFCFAADCRGRLEYPVPETYFGNCITQCNATLRRSELKGEGGFVNAVKVIDRAINDMKKEPFRGMENWKERFSDMFGSGRVLVVGGSPKFKVYENDMGFGKPCKVEMVQSLKGLSIAESGKNDGGIELGVVLKNKSQRKTFLNVVKQGLKALK